MPKNERNAPTAALPSTLERSAKKAQDIYTETLESAERSYAGDEARAHRAAWGSVKHSFEKVGDHWEPKSMRGPSDPRAAEGGPDASGPAYGGVDVESRTKDQLLEWARTLGADVNTHMSKAQLGRAIEAVNDSATRQARATDATGRKGRGR